MREISTEFLRDEIVRLDAIVTESNIFHFSGIKLHAAGDTILLKNAKLMYDLAILNLVLLEPGESESALLKNLGVEKTDPGQLAPGDVLTEETRGASGTVLAAAGTCLNAELIEKIRQTKRGSIAIRRAGNEAEIQQAINYLNLIRLIPANPSPLETRMTRITRLNSFRLLPLLAPRASVLVVLANDFFRTLITNTLVTAGHEVASSLSLMKAVSEGHSNPDIVVTDAETTPAVVTEFRKDTLPPRLMILACVAEGQAEAYKALQSGANDTLSMPPRPEFLLDRIRACQTILGRKSRLIPFVQGNRRAEERKECKATCSIKDPLIVRPLPVVSADVLESSERGIRIDYNLPSWPAPWAYVPGGVHPRHFFYNYAKGNPMARDLTVVIETPGALPMQRVARAIHIAPVLSQVVNLEVLGLEFQAP